MVSRSLHVCLMTNALSQLVQYCIFYLCKHPEYQGPLRAEALMNKDVIFSTSNQEMPYLDSFVKETARLSPGPIRKSLYSTVT